MASDHDPERMTRGARRGFVVLAVAMLAVGAASVIASVGYAAMTAGQLRAQLRAACAVAADVGGAPIPDAPKPTRLGVSIIADFRHQWRALDCPGTLPVQPGLARWAAYYHLPAS